MPLFIDRENILFNIYTMNLQSRMVLFLILCISFTLLSSNLYASSGLTAVTSATNRIRAYVNNVRVLARALGGIIGCIGAIKIYHQWSLGDRKILRPILGWGGAMLFLHLAPTFILSLIYGGSGIYKPVFEGDATGIGM